MFLLSDYIYIYSLSSFPLLYPFCIFSIRNLRWVVAQPYEKPCKCNVHAQRNVGRPTDHLAFNIVWLDETAGSRKFILQTSVSLISCISSNQKSSFCCLCFLICILILLCFLKYFSLVETRGKETGMEKWI